MFTSCLLLLTLSLCAPAPSESANILGYLAIPGRSHFIIHDSLMRGLAAKGHNVTVVGIFPKSAEPIPNYHYIQVPLDPKEEQVFLKSKGAMVQGTNTYSNMLGMIQKMHQMMTDVLGHPTIEELKRTGSFDLVVLGFLLNDYQVGLAAHFGCPAVIITGTPAFKSLRDMVGNPYGASHVPNIMMSMDGRAMNFKQRLVNYLFWIGEHLIFAFVDTFVYESVYSRHFPSDRYPSFAEAKRNVSLVLVNSHLSLGSPMPLMPGLIEVSGIQIKKNAAPLPPNIAQWLDGAEDGAIYFSLGTVASSKHMPPEKVQMFVNVFGRLKQRVLWKWEGAEIANKPANLMTVAWLPQDDVLAHKNVHLFISHCGLGSMNEAKYHGVPILGLPLFGDQPSNAKAIAQAGWSLELDFQSLSEQTLSDGLHEMLANSRYRDVVQKKSQLYKDRPEHPLDKAIWWVEYVLRHQGAKHMQSEAVYQNWVQYNSYDVTAFLLAIFIVFLYLVKCVILLVWRQCIVKCKSKQE